MVRASNRQLTAVVLLVAVLCAPLPFLPALGNDFAGVWDDNGMLVENHAFREISPTSLRWMFSTFLAGHYQPLSWLTFALDYRLWGMNPRGYHLTNLLLHGLNALLFALLLRRLPVARGGGAHPTQAFRFAGALAGTLFFALHPLRTESVAWAVQRRDLLAAAFLIGTLLAYVIMVGKPRPQRARWYLAGLGLFLLSLLSKATGITFAAVLLVLDGYPLRRFGTRGESSWPGPAARAVLAEKVPFLVLGALFALVAAAAQRDAGAALTIEQHPLGHRLVQAVYALGFYAWKTVFPVGLSPLYEIPFPFPTTSPRFLVPLVAVPLGALALIACRRRFPGVAVAFAIYSVVLLPVLGILQSGPQLVADRYSYVACMPLAALFGAGFSRLLSRAGRGPSLALPSLLVAAVLFATGLALFSWRQTLAWRGGKTLWELTVRNSPLSPIAHYNLGMYYRGEGSPDKAEAAWRRAIELRPDYADCLNDLGGLLSELGRGEEAVTAYNRAIASRPLKAIYHYNLGQEYTRLRRRPLAIAAFRRALALAPSYADAHFALGLALLATGDMKGARREQTLLAPLDRTRAEFLGNLAGYRPQP